MILVLLDTNSYLRLAKRVRPAIGVQFGQLDYVLTVHKITEDEVHRSPRLRLLFPWFDEEEHANERMGKQIRLSAVERAQVDAAQSVLRATVLEDPLKFMVGKRQPPSKSDCFLLAVGQVKPAIVVTDDLGMHDLAKEFGSVSGMGGNCCTSCTPQGSSIESWLRKFLRPLRTTAIFLKLGSS